jgi:hypothetical protein
MARKKCQNIHTSPETAGEKNMPKDYASKKADDMHTMEKLLPIYNHGRYVAGNYKGLWTEELFQEEVANYFQYCADNSVKPCKAGLRTWLNVSRDQYHQWETKPEKYGYKSDILGMAGDVMEMSYIQRGEKYPTMNTFLLRTSHGHVESSKMDVTTNGQSVNSADDVHDLISKLGLDKANK